MDQIHAVYNSHHPHHQQQMMHTIRSYMRVLHYHTNPQYQHRRRTQRLIPQLEIVQCYYYDCVCGVLLGFCCTLSKSFNTFMAHSYIKGSLFKFGRQKMAGGRMKNEHIYGMKFQDNKDDLVKWASYSCWASYIFLSKSVRGLKSSFKLSLMTTGMRLNLFTCNNRLLFFLMVSSSDVLYEKKRSS